MKFKLDENFGTRTQSFFREAGHDVQTILQERLQGASDEQLYEICRTENRCLVTLDLDFANVIRFPPTELGGIIVIRLPHNPSLSTLEQLASQFLQALERMQVEHKLWIVELGRIRIHQSQAEDE